MNQPNQTITLDPFEAPNGFERKITIGDQTRTYFVTEMTDAVCSKVFDTTNGKGVRDPDKVATLSARAVAACVTRADGSAITFAEARGFRRPLLDALMKEVLDVHGYGVDQAEVVEEAEKN